MAWQPKPKTLQLHFHFTTAIVNHFANMYGFKTRTEAQPTIDKLLADPLVDVVILKCQWKDSKFGPWKSWEEKLK